MKKWILIFAVCLFGINASAQFGLKGGANFATITGDDTEDTKMRVAFYMGVLYNIMINEMFSFQPELVYSSQGTKSDDVDETKLILNYLNLTPMFRYNTQSAFWFGTGPQFGLLLSAKIKEGNTSVDWKEFIKGFDFAWAFALGYQLQSGLGFYGRYNLGLANISDTGGNLKNSVIAIGLRYMLNTQRQ
jgi:hypothetical protein